MSVLLLAIERRLPRKRLGVSSPANDRGQGLFLAQTPAGGDGRNPPLNSA